MDRGTIGGYLLGALTSGKIEGAVATAKDVVKMFECTRVNVDKVADWDLVWRF